MNTERAQPSPSLAFVVPLALGLIAILGPLGGLAGASHTTINADPNSDTNLVGTSHTVTATTSVPGVFVNFNVETGLNSDGDPPLGTTSDGECTTDATAPHQCAFTYDGTGGTGMDEIRVWSDEGADNDVFQEGEPNELVTKTWVEHDPATARLDCSPESGENPVTGDDSSHEITCTVTDSSGDPFLGAEVDFENETTDVNDPDDDAERAASGVIPMGGPDNSCMTSDEPAGDGACSVTYDSEGETGTATIRAWVDADGDDTTDESDEAEGANQTDSDGTDVVTKTWVVSTVNASPESVENPVGTEHTITAATSAPSQVVNSNVESGPNSDDGDLMGGPTDFECTTDADAAGGHTCSFTYTGSGGAGQDNIRVWIDTDEDDEFETDEPNDFVQKTWVKQDPTRATLDCDPETGENPLEGPGASHDITCTVLDQNGDPFLGANVDFENESPTVQRSRRQRDAGGLRAAWAGRARQHLRHERRARLRRNLHGDLRLAGGRGHRHDPRLGLRGRRRHDRRFRHERNPKSGRRRQHRRGAEDVGCRLPAAAGCMPERRAGRQHLRRHVGQQPDHRDAGRRHHLRPGRRRQGERARR
jgi:hypothetical protein